LEWVRSSLGGRLINRVAVVEGVDDWNDITFILCNKVHSQFVSETGDITGKNLMKLNNIDLKPTLEFLRVCKGKFTVFLNVI
jgi:hypothetical protein